MTDDVQRFYARWRSLSDLGQAQQVLEWDQQVMMPPRGGEQRSRQLAALAEALHERLVDPQLGELIARLEARRDALDDDQRADLREARRAYDREVKIPQALVAERARVCSLAQGAWAEAKERDAFAAFLPHLREVVRLTRELARAIGTPNPYDALLDDYEPGMTEGALRPLFAELRDRLVALLDRLRGGRPPSQEVLRRCFPRAAQERFSRRVMLDLGYELEAGRLDVSAHPFTAGTLGDVRITTRYDERFLPTALFGVIHEAGHAIYEQGLDPARYRDPAGQACSLGVHESQSRFWENLIGRSRPFWERYLPLARQAFPGVLDDVGPDELYGALNVCQPSLIRIEADEVTYNLHIILRFELESALLAGDLEAVDLPGAWHERMQRLLGLTPPTDRDGVLQDVHWSAGLFGYFPTYALGNLYGAQIMAALRGDLPDLDGRVAAGDFAAIKDWLRRKIHRHGRRYLAPELIERVCGAAPTASAALTYLDDKYRAIYGC
jgi:carboxypeptidase Taq